MKMIYTVVLIFVCSHVGAQKIDSIFVNLYTDSLKRNTYNYINIDGLFSNGMYLPLDSNDIILSSSHGKFYGNSLWIDSTHRTEKVKIKAVLRKDDQLWKEFVMYIKKKPDDEPLMDNKQYLEKIKKDKKKQKDKFM